MLLLVKKNPSESHLFIWSVCKKVWKKIPNFSGRPTRYSFTFNFI